MTEVMVTYYNRPGLWLKVLQGLEWNAERISRLVMVESGPPWNLPKERPLGISDVAVVRCRKASPEFFEVARAMNLGMHSCQATQVLHIDDDIVLPQGTVARLEESLMVNPIPLAFGHGWTTSPDTPIDNLKKPPTKFWVPTLNKPYHLARGAIFLVDRAKFLLLGGWNQEMLDYGLQDYEFTARWMARYGYNSCGIVPVFIWHLEAVSGKKAKPPEGSYNLKAIFDAEVSLTRKLT